MRLFNKGKRTVFHTESAKPGAACTPGALFTVSDSVGAKLKKLYPRELECLDDAKAKFAEPAEQPKVAAKGA